MARPRGKTNTPEDATKEFFTLESVPKSWLSLPITKKEAKQATDIIKETVNEFK